MLIFRPNREQFKSDVGELVIYQLNLSSLKSVRECAKSLLTKEPAIHLLVNNAGVMMCPFEKTEDDIEMHLQTNHIGHFLLTLLLLPKIMSSGSNCRIVNVSSKAHFCTQVQQVMCMHEFATNNVSFSQKVVDCHIQRKAWQWQLYK